MTNFEKKLYPSDIAMSPFFAINRFRAGLQKYGEETVFRDSKFKKARELWISAAFLLGLSVVTKKSYWVMPEHKENTPDTYGISFDKSSRHEKGLVRNILNIEVCEWEEHAKLGLLDLIENKLGNKDYPEFYALLVYAKKPGEIINLEEIHQDLKKSDVGQRAGEIFLLSSALGNYGHDHLLAGLYPDALQLTFPLKELLKINEGQKDMLKLFRGIGDQFVVNPDYYIPLPEL